MVSKYIYIDDIETFLYNLNKGIREYNALAFENKKRSLLEFIESRIHNFIKSDEFIEDLKSIQKKNEFPQNPYFEGCKLVIKHIKEWTPYPEIEFDTDRTINIKAEEQFKDIPLILLLAGYIEYGDYIVDELKKLIPLQIGPEDIKSIDALWNKIRGPRPIDKFIFGKFPPELRQLRGILYSYKSDLIFELNKLIFRDSLYDNNEHPFHKFPDNIRTRIEHKPKRKDLFRLNRDLLNNYYPSDIKKSLEDDTYNKSDNNLTYEKGTEEKTVQEKISEKIIEIKSNKGTKVNEFESQIIQKETKINELESQITQKGAQVKELESQISENGTQLKGLESQIAQKETKINELESQIAQKGTQLKGLESQITQKEAKNKELENENEELENENKSLFEKIIKEYRIIGSLFKLESNTLDKYVERINDLNNLYYKDKFNKNIMMSMFWAICIDEIFQTLIDDEINRQSDHRALNHEDILNSLIQVCNVMIDNLRRFETDRKKIHEITDEKEMRKSISFHAREIIKLYRTEDEKEKGLNIILNETKIDNILGIQNYSLKEFVILPLNKIVPSTEGSKLVMAIIQKSLIEYLRIYGKKWN